VVSERIRFERHGEGAQFVELGLWRQALTRTFGRIGTPGTTRATDHASDEAARKEWTHQIRRLEGRGYLAGHHQPGLLATIRARPDDPAPYSVYADWLLERHDPRGELISAMLGGLAEPARALLLRHDVQLAPAWWKTQGLAGVWRWGFLQKMNCDSFHGGAVRRLLRHPSAMVLEELAITGRFALPELQFALERRPQTLQRITVLASTTSEKLSSTVPGLVRV